MPTKAEAASILLARRKARESLLAFTEMTHPSWETSEHHIRICEALERLERGDIRRLIIEAPPRHSKTELASRRFPAWCLGRHPDWQIIALTHGDELAKDTGKDVQDIIWDEQFKLLFRGVELRADASAAGRWRLSAGGIYVAAGIHGRYAGRGAHLAIIDDPYGGRDEADSPRMRQRVIQAYYADVLTRLMRSPPGKILIMCTRWHTEDLIGHLREVDAEAWEVLTLPAISGEGTDEEQALWPGRYPLSALHEIRDSMAAGGRLREWRAQYQQQPTAEEGIYFKREWFTRRWKIKPKHLHVYITSDFAVTEAKEGSDPDWTEHAVWGIDPSGAIYALDWWSGQTTADVWIDALIDLCAEHQPLCWFGEAGQIRRAIEPFLSRRCDERRVYFRQEWIASVSDKAIRSRSLQARAAMGKIVFPADAFWGSEVIEQLVSFPTGRHDDKVDCASLMCRVLDTAHPAVAPVEVVSESEISDYGGMLDEADGWETV